MLFFLVHKQLVMDKLILLLMVVCPINHFWIGPSGFVSNLPNISNLCVGTYCDSIVDDNGCNITVCEFLDFDFPCSPEIETNDIF